jgi:formylglycine-generating enzyme
MARSDQQGRATPGCAHGLLWDMSSRSSSGPVTSGDPRGMVWVAGGSFLMGSEDFYPEERPVHRVAADGFWMDEHPVTVAEFERFVIATGHVTTAECAPEAADYPDASPEQLVPGSLVFRQPTRPVPLHDFRAWWAWVPGAQWRHPEGPDSTTDGLELHPVTHVSHADALAYAAWAGKSLPTEVEWELAARGGLDGAVFAWGDEFAPAGQMMANTWQGDFPLHNEALDGFQRTSPVGTFPPNGFGLHDVAGNVWEWTDTPYTPHHHAAAGRSEGPTTTPARTGSCCGPRREHAPPPATGVTGTRVIKGGSHLCAPNYCLRYRPAARQSQTVDTSTSHIGIRCVARP